jgi:TIR domain-containing protein
MPLDHLETWLGEAGYSHQCFISWPHHGSREITDCAWYLKEGIENRLRDETTAPSVFLDETSIAIGDEWPETLRKGLCGSVTMVAILAPMYYHPAHRWCGLEWATMDQLSQRRLPGAGFKSIIPVMVRRSTSLPAAVSGLQYFDVSGLLTSTGAYYRTNQFRSLIETIFQRIESVADAIAQKGSRAACDQFQFPTESAFSDYVHTALPFPFRT